MKTESHGGKLPLDQAMSIEHACARLCAAFVRRVDARDESVADLFTGDARLILLGYDLTGQAEIRAFIRGLPQPQELVTLHFCGNVAIEATGSTEARGTADMMYFNGKSTDGIARLPQLTPRAIGTYHDEYCLSASGWLIASREFKANFLAQPA